MAKEKPVFINWACWSKKTTLKKKIIWLLFTKFYLYFWMYKIQYIMSNLKWIGGLIYHFKRHMLDFDTFTSTKTCFSPFKGFQPIVQIKVKIISYQQCAKHLSMTHYYLWFPKLRLIVVWTPFFLLHGRTFVN